MVIRFPPGARLGKEKGAKTPRGMARAEGGRVFPPGSKRRGALLEKVSIGWQGDPVELGERLHWEACRHGLGRARQSLASADEVPWIWPLIGQRWKDAPQVLDFYHASQHLHALAEALHPVDQQARQQWVDQPCHDLRHGGEKKLLKRIARLPEEATRAAEVIRRKKNYFHRHSQRLNYQALSRRGWPIGSGSVESACAQRQRRFKRPGQFWTSTGLRRLNALIEARDLNHWVELWVN